MSTATPVKFHPVRCNPYTHGLDGNGVFAVVFDIRPSEFYETDPTKIIQAARDDDRHADRLTGHVWLQPDDDRLVVWFRADSGEEATRIGTSLAVFASGDEAWFTVVPGVEVDENIEVAR